MLLNAFHLIQKMQNEIGNDVEIKIRVERYAEESDALEIRADWWREDFHAIFQIPIVKIEQIANENIIIDRTIGYFKREYDNRQP